MEKLIFSDLIGSKVAFEDNNFGKEGRTKDSADLVNALNRNKAKIVFVSKC